jgi:hypothetical protein
MKKLREDVITVIYAALMSEREACAKLAAKHQKPGQCIDKRIRDRPPFQLPMLAFEITKAAKKEKKK